MSEPEFRRAILAGYPDRVAQRREPGSPQFLLASGTGARLAEQSGVREAELIVALDIALHVGADLRVGPGRQPSRQGRFGLPRRSSREFEASGGGTHRSAPTTMEPLIRMASAVDREWLQPTSSEVVHRFEAATGRVKAARVDRYDAIVLAQHHVAADREIAARLLADAWLERGPQGADEQLVRRLRFAGHDIDIAELARTAAYEARSIDDIDLSVALPPAAVHHLDRDAPPKLLVPSGRSHPLEYHEDGSVSLSVKLQELFGLAESPRIGRNRVAVRLALLAPNGRPVQVTQDLRSFWERTYPEVRKELRGRYPKHPWPEDPWTASPTARPKRTSS